MGKHHYMATVNKKQQDSTAHLVTVFPMLQSRQRIKSRSIVCHCWFMKHRVAFTCKPFYIEHGGSFGGSILRDDDAVDFRRPLQVDCIAVFVVPSQ